MAQFSYKARRRDGKVVQGEIQSADEKAAKNALLNRGIRPIKIVRMKDSQAGAVKKTKGFIYRDAQGAIQIRLSRELPKAKEIAVFTKQFSLMIENGVPLLQSLTLLQSQQKKEGFTEVIAGVQGAVERGASLSEAMAPYPEVFDSLYLAMVRAGEASGRLDVILRQLVTYIEKMIKIRSQIKSAATYPVLIVFVAVAVLTGLLAFVVPTFAQQFKENEQQLPALTQLVIDASDGFLANAHYFFLFIVAVVIGIKMWVGTEDGRKRFDKFILRIPVIGDVLTKIAIGRFCSTLATLLTSGVSLLESLLICASSSGNKEVERMVLEVRQRISEGHTFAEPLAQTGLIPRMVSSMVAVGETTGTLDATLTKITEIYDDEVDTAIKAMTSLIEPVLIVVIGSIVGFVVIAMYLPVFDMASTVGGGG